MPDRSPKRILCRVGWQVSQVEEVDELCLLRILHFSNIVLFLANCKIDSDLK